MTTIRPVDDESEYHAALAVPALLAAVFALAEQTWTCRRCGAQTWLLSEICDGCGAEDLEQGGA